jgi:acetylornithine deacetylase/succinyl-diaminopimelate desuccinylase-like protein
VDPRFDPPHSLGNVTQARTRDGAIELAMDARLLPQQDVDALVESFRPSLESLPGATLVSARAAQGMALAEDAELVRRMKRVLERHGLDPRARAKATSTEAGVFSRAGFEVAVFGPSPSTGNAHTANEYALLDELEKAIDVYESAIRELCS